MELSVLDPLFSLRQHERRARGMLHELPQRILHPWRGPTEKQLEAAVPHTREITFLPHADMLEMPNEYKITMELPGMKMEEVNINYYPEQRRLEVTGERKSEQQEQLERGEYRIVREERSFGVFQRIWHLPKAVDVEHIKADVHQGLLTVHVPRVEPSEEAREVMIKIE